MDSLFAHAQLADVHQDVLRNIVSRRVSEDLFSDLSDAPADWKLAQQLEDAIKPAPYRSATPVIHRPFEDAAWFNAIAWPFRHWQVSRFSDGTFGVWYGAESIETTVCESVYHWVHGLLADARFDDLPVSIERKVYAVACDAALLDLRAADAGCTGLRHPTDYHDAQAVGARLHREGHPGLMTRSVRRPEGECFAIFNPAVLGNPRHQCYLTYHLDGLRAIVERQAGVPWFELDVAALDGGGGKAYDHEH